MAGPTTTRFRSVVALFSPTLVDEVRQLPGASHSFLKHLCSEEGAAVREELDKAVQALPQPVRLRFEELLSSLDNRRFFQGFAELSLTWVLRASGWEIEGLTSVGSLVQARRPVSGEQVNLLACGFVHSSRPTVDGNNIQKLHDALNRVRGRTRFAVFVRKWLPLKFNSEPIRQAVELWVREVEAGRWDNRFAAYEDESVSLEFGLVGGLEEPERVHDRHDGPVLMTVGPFIGGRTMGAIERRLVRELDRYRLGPHGREPVLAAAVADRPWQIPRGYLREFLYGKPRWVQTQNDDQGAPWEAALSKDIEPCLFKDGLYENVGGVLMIERDRDDPLLLKARGMSNPLSRSALQPDEFLFPTVAETRKEDGRPVIRGFTGEIDSVRLGR